MRKLIFLFTLFTTSSFAQTDLISGSDGAMTIIFDKSTRVVTGYYNNATGEDEQTGGPKFTCIFYLKGTAKGKTFNIRTYDPGDSTTMIEGTMEIVDSRTFKIKLKENHGGCWNVQNFSDEAVTITLNQPSSDVGIRFVTKDKAYFYSQQNEATKRKAYILKGDVVYVEKIAGDWLYCRYQGKAITKGWMKAGDLNRL